jgi:HEPN domain-containing protein
MSKTGRDFQRLAELRSREAKALLKSRYKQGAYYFGGLAIECALKACIAKKTKKHDFPKNVKIAQKVYSHDLSELLKVTELEIALETAMKADPTLAAHWGVVKGWKVESRYETSGLNGKDMIDGMDGVLQWIRLHW